MAQNKRRNIVMILSDSLRPDFLDVYTDKKIVPTPNIDALAQNGIVFENAVTPSTVCAPARASILTGSAVSAHDQWTNLVPRKDNLDYFPQRLSNAGYATAAFGTLDHIRKETPCGIQYVNPNNDYDCYDEYLNWLKERHPDETKPVTSGNDGHFKYEPYEHYDRYSCDCATKFIEHFANNHTMPDREHCVTKSPNEGEDTPFFVLCGFLMPHQPYFPPRDMIGKVNKADIPDIITSDRNEDLPDVERYRRVFLNSKEELQNLPHILNRRMDRRVAYCEMICAVDEYVGRIVNCLKENGVYDNTTIVFCADHGSVEDDYNVRTKGPWAYTSQLFVPLIVSNQPDCKGRSDCLCSTVDIGATLLQIAGDEKRFGVSRSLFDMANKIQSERKTVMSEFCDSCKTIVDKQYTFTYYPFTARYALYDRIADPEMRNDLANDAKYRETANKFLMEIIDWLTLAKGLRLEAHDVVPKVKEGIEEKDPKFLDDFLVAYPIGSERDANRLKDAGLDADYNDFCLKKDELVGKYYKKF